MTRGASRADNLTGKRATVVGAARSGMAAARLLAEAGAAVFVTDSGPIDEPRRAALSLAGIAFEEGGHTARALDADLVVTSPGVPATAELLVSAGERGLPVYSELEAASWFCRAPIVAVTGSNGKTTTTSLLGYIFQSTGRPTHVAGNIGHPFSDVAAGAQPDDIVVLEVSSFQLDHVRTFRPHVSVLLNITPDHLDRYGGSMAAYAASKLRICNNQQGDDACVFNMDDDTVATGVRKVARPDAPRAYGFSLDEKAGAAGFVRSDEIVLRIGANEEVLMQRRELALRGRHNTGNSLAAAVAARIMEVRSEIVRSSLASFEGVPHRLEFVREVNGVRYVNDSKATNVNAVWYALESMSEPVVLIAGGRDKGNDYGPLKELVRDRVRVLIAIGESAAKVESELGNLVESSVSVENMTDAVRYASLLARPGECVLLSPACASFDMFRDYEDRGDTFRRLVSEV